MEVLNVKEDRPKTYGFGVRHLQILCMLLTMVCLIINRGSMGVAVLAMSDSSRINSTESQIYDWDKQTQSIILSSYFWGYAIMQIPSGILARRFGGKPMLLMAIICNAILCLLIPILADWGGWTFVCVARIITGLTQACLFPATQTLLGQWLPASEVTSYSGLVYGGMQIGTIIAMPLSGVLSDSKMGWKLIFYVISCILFVDAVIWHLFAASRPRDHSRISKEEREYIEAGLNISDKKLPPTPWKHILRSKPTWACLGPQIGFNLSFVLFLVDMPTYLEKALRISLRNSAMLSALPYVGMLIGGLFATFTSEKLYNKGLISLTCSRKLFQSLSLFGVACGLIVLSFTGPENKSIAVGMLIVCLTMVGFSSAGFIVNQLDLSPNYAGVIYSLMNFITNIGTVLMPITTSFILRNDSSDVSRWKVVFLLMAGITASANVLYILLGTSERQEWDDPNFLNKKLDSPDELKPVLKEHKTKE